MALLVEFAQSHRYSLDKPVRAAFRLTLTPIGGSKASGLHYIVLIDTSGSMKGDKIRAVKRAALRLLELLPDHNYITLLLFGTSFHPFYEVKVAHELVETARAKVEEVVRRLAPQNGTPLYGALRTALGIASKSSESGYIIVLTDGRPTDVRDPEEYRRLPWPEKYRGVFIGIGLDYNAELLNLLADISNGVSVHVDEARLEELVEAFEETAVSEVAAKDVEVVAEGVAGEVRLLGYREPRVYIPAISDEAVEIIGELTIPPRYEGSVAKVVVTYVEPESGERKHKVFDYSVRPASSREEFLQGIDREVYNSYLYAVYIEEARRLALEGKLDEATRRLEKAATAAAQTRRIDLIEATKRLIEDVEATKRLEPEAATRRLASEATKRLRGA